MKTLLGHSLPLEFHKEDKEERNSSPSSRDNQKLSSLVGDLRPLHKEMSVNSFRAIRNQAPLSQIKST